MTKQKVIITNSESKIETFIADGWKVKSVTAQHVALAGNAYGDLKGKFLIVLECEV
jgi:hypothetical protein